MSDRWPLVVGPILVVGAAVAAIVVSGADPDVLKGIATVAGIFGAAMVLRTIGPRDRR